MGRQEVGGKTVEELAELHEQHLDSGPDVDFEEYYCLTKCKQPDDYDGPKRYCSRITRSSDFCWSHRQCENLSPTANMTHGLTALRKHFVDDFSDDERKAYEEIVEEWSEYYNIEDPSSIDTLEAMAIEIVREVRADQVAERHRNSAGYTDDGLTRLKEEFGPDGDVAGHDNVPNHIVDISQSTRSSIEKLKDKLGITRKHQDRMTAETDKTAQLEAISESVSASLDGGTYDPDEFEGESEE